jgi:hypothetical protein
MTVPRLALVDQTVVRLYEWGITELGVIQANHPLTNFSASVQICSIDTLSRRVLPLPTPWVLVDEAHLWRNFCAECMARDEWQSTRFIGPSATPWTKSMELARMLPTVLKHPQRKQSLRVQQHRCRNLEIDPPCCPLGIGIVCKSHPNDCVRQVGFDQCRGHGCLLCSNRPEGVRPTLELGRETKQP